MKSKADEMEKITKEYIVKLLEWQEVKLKCVNLGFTSNKEIHVELSLVKHAKEYLEELGWIK